MRLTNSTLLRGYNRDLSRLRNAKNDCERKITSTRKFNRASEAPLSAAKALNIRKSQYYSAQYKENLNVAEKFYTEAETSLLQVSEKMATIRETIIAAVNTTKDSVDYNIYAQQLETRAQELCAIFNTDSAGRSIFGGDSDNAMPFNIINDSDGRPSTVLYHNVPVNAMNDYTGFPYSNDVYMDIGIGMVTDQNTHAQDPMSVLNISFNGMKISGCGADYGVADIDLSSIQNKRNYVIDVYADGRKKTLTFTGQTDMQDNVDTINKLLGEAYEKDKNQGLPYPKMDDQGMIRLYDKDGKSLENGVVSVVNNTSLADSTRTDKLVIDNDSNYTNKFRLNASGLPSDRDFRVDVEVNGVRKTITFNSGATEDELLANFQDALDAEFVPSTDPNADPKIYKVNVTMESPNKGVVSAEGAAVKIWKTEIPDSDVVADDVKNAADVPFERERIFSNNYIQLTLDAARALRNDDIEYANACIDRIVTANEKLLGQIADLGCNEDFIDFNKERITTREENLAERQNELETTDPEYQITLWKTYEAYYNACLQMSSSVIPNSIFNYMK